MGMAGRRGEQRLQRRHNERARLARAGLGARNQVRARQRQRNDRALDGARLLVAKVTCAFEQTVIEVQ